MADEEKVINEFYEKEFPDTMPFDDISVKLDTLGNHPHIQQLIRIFCDNLVFALTEGYVKYDDASLVACDGSLLNLVARKYGRPSRHKLSVLTVFLCFCSARCCKVLEKYS